MSSFFHKLIDLIFVSHETENVGSTIRIHVA